jgi:Ca2+-transporting ATPase
MNYHHLSIHESFELTGSSKKGLSVAEAETKLQEYGPNILQETKKKSAWLILLNQFKDFMVLILLVAAVISGVVGDLTDTIIIIIIVILNAIIGFSQEYRAEEAMQLLKKMAALQAKVLRDGVAVSLPAAELVPGDIVLLETGNSVPADLRFIETHSLKIDESALTGESVSVEKITAKLKEDNLPLGDRLNMAYKGTIVTNGRANALVVATGMNTEIGKIARLLQENESATPLQIRMADYGRKLSLVVLGICIILFGMGLLRGEKVMDMLLLSISLAVAAIPEALPALITIALAMGAKRLVKQNALIRKLTAVETLGSVSYICSDKTGTLTLNKMKVVRTSEEVANLESLPYPALHLAMVLNHDVTHNENAAAGNKHLGDPTEIALVEYMHEKLGIKTYDEIVALLPRVAELPFDTDRKCMTSIHQWEGKYLLFSKGATESISENLSAGENKTQMHLESIELAKQGLRVLAFAYKILDAIPSPFTYENVEKELKFVGLVGMIDPPREEVKVAIAECKSAGIRPVMITGDHPATAEAIAKEIGILEKNGLVVTGKVLQSMTSKELEDKVEKIRVYARVSPEQKINIVKALQARGHYVSMTGDGVNDAPALRAANIGIAMGINGTDVSKEAAHMILLDDNFATIVKAVKEGRRIYDNIRKFVKYIMTCNGAEIWTIFLAPLVGLPIPLLPIQILWINLVTDGLPGLALAKEQAETDIMKQPPRNSTESLFAGGIAYHILWVGLLMAGVTLGVQAWAIQQHNTHWQTMVFTVLSLSQLGHVLAIKSEKTFLYQQGIFSNRPLIMAVIFTAALQVAIIYIPFANDIFKTQPLNFQELMICIGLSAVVFHAVELEKWIKKRYFARL